MVAIDYLDLYQLLVIDISGTTPIFIFLSFTVIGFICSMFRLPNTVALTMFVVYGVIISAFFQSILAIVLVIVGIFFGWAISRLMSRG